MHDSGDAIVITGIGAITPIGVGGEALWKAVMTSHCGIDTITRFDPSPFSTRIAAEVNGFDPLEFLNPKQARRMDRYSQLSVAASTMALRDAGLAPETLTPSRTGICLGTALGGVGMAEHEHTAFMEGGPRAISPHLALSVFIGAGSCNVAIEFGFTGPATANGDSCASGLIALGNALNYLRRGEADVMLAGAAEAPLSPLTFNAFSVIRAMSTRNDDPQTASRPFDRLRDGFVMAEGSAMFVLETRRHAENRGASIYAELGGFSLTNDAEHMAAPRGDGESSARAMRQAIERAGLTADDIVAVSAPRFLDAVERQDGNHGDQAGAGRGASAQGADLWYQGPARSCTGRDRRVRGRDLLPGDAPRHDSRHGASGEPRPRMRPGLRRKGRTSFHPGTDSVQLLRFRRD